MRIQHLLVPLAIAVAATACGGAASPEAAKAPARQVVTLEGYPLDRTLPALAAWRDLDAVVVVSDVQLGSPAWTTADGAEPAYITEGRAPTQAEGARNYMIVTGFTATVEQTLLGSTTTRRISGSIPGGSIGNVDFVASDDIAPALSEMNGRLLMAGAFTNGVLDPAFVYRVGGDGTATSLLASGSDAKAEFSLSSLKAALLRR